MIRNVAASVHQRLLNIAKAKNQRFNDLFQHYALERWLYRLSVSPHAERFILKGALMLTAWQVPIMRPTRDIDLLARASNDLDSMRTMIAEICAAPVEDDGLSFDADSIVTGRIAEGAEYEGVRATFQGKLATARAPMQIDVGFSDVVTPEPVSIEYPTVLTMPAPRLWAYNRETTIAEKFEAMVKLGELNSRMKDFFDIWMLATNHAFDGKLLAQTIRTTFERRGTQIALDASCFCRGFAAAAAKQAQWQAFIKRSGLDEAPADFEGAWSMNMNFLQPIAEALQGNRAFDCSWPPGGPWQGS